MRYMFAYTPRVIVPVTDAKALLYYRQAGWTIKEFKTSDEAKAFLSVRNVDPVTQQDYIDSLEETNWQQFDTELKQELEAQRRKYEERLRRSLFDEDPDDDVL